MSADNDSKIIWCLLDGRMGHQNQVLGFAEELARRGTAKIQAIEVSSQVRGLKALWNFRHLTLPSGPPDLIVGAGHGCHVLMCQLRRRFQTPTVVMMKPSLPLSCFDFALIPRADGVLSRRPSVILTDGALNRMQPSTRQQVNSGLILVGGPSKHFSWSDDRVLTQLSTVMKRQPEFQWTIANSRRTPASLTAQLLSMANDDVRVVTVDSAASDWLPNTLAVTEQVWVSEDSVSMTYEALTAGCCVGLLRLKRLRQNRVTGNVDQLLEKCLVTSFDEWTRNSLMVKPTAVFCETSRCVSLILKQLKWPGFHVAELASEVRVA